jgi:hypothetical protein
VDDIVAWMAAVAKGLDPIEEEKKARPGLYKVCVISTHTVYIYINVCIEYLVE